MMVNVPVWDTGPSAAPKEVQGNVYLLAVDSISDLHSAPLDMGTPQEQEVLLKAHDEKSTSTPLETPEALRADHPVSGSSGSPCTNALLTLLIVITLVSMSLLLYILHLYRNQDGLLRTLTENFNAQTNALQRVSMNHTFNWQESR